MSVALLALFALSQSPFASEAPLVIENISIEPASPVLWQPVEISFTLKGTWSNVFDPRQVSVSAEVAGSKDLFADVPGFVAAPPYSWKVRFAPWSAGPYKVTLTAFDSLGRFNPKPITFSVHTEKGVTGFVETKEKSRYFVRSDGHSQILVGPVVSSLGDAQTAWQAGANCVVFDASSCVDHFEPAKLDNCEAVLREASSKQAYVVLRLGSDSWMKAEWANNPFNAKNGGPCAKPDDFFASLQPRLQYKRYLRYFFARLNAYSSLAGIEVWHGAAPEYWLEEMFEEMRALHPFGIPLFANPSATEWVTQPWLRTAATSISDLQTIRTLAPKPTVVEAADAATALCSGASAIITSNFQGLSEFAQLLEWKKRNFDVRDVSAVGSHGSALIDGDGGLLCLVSEGPAVAGNVGVAMKRGGQYSCQWFSGSKEVARTSAKTTGNDLEIAHPAFTGQLLGLLKRDG